MFNALKLQTRFIVLQLIILVSTSILAYTSYTGLSNLSLGLDHSLLSSEALLNHTTGDMMHDALRADVLAALLAGDQSNDQDRKSILADLDEHSKLFQEKLADNKKLELPDDIRLAIEAIGPALQAYIAGATEMVNLAFKDTAAANKKFEEFSKLFSDLEEKQGTVSDLILKVQTGNKDKAVESGVSAKHLVLSVSIALMLISAFLTLLLAKSITNPLQNCATALQKITAGDTKVALSYPVDDQIGQVTKGVMNYRDNVIHVSQLQAEQEAERKRAEKEREEARARQIAEQESMRHKTDAEKRQTMKTLADSFESTVKKIVEGVSNEASALQILAQTLSSSAEKTTQQASVVAAASEEASTNVQTVAAAAEQLSSSINEIGRQVVDSARIANEAALEADKSTNIMNNLIEGAAKIGEVLKLISDIANQTNLLALNATIEAARAGDAGKGFAVVAAEVKNLANQTASATEEISGHITAIQQSTGNVADVIKSITATIKDIDEISRSIHSAVEEQTAATQEIARNVQEASSGTKEVSNNIVNVTEAANDSGTASGKVLHAANDLFKQSKDLAGEVNGFIERIRNSS